MSEVYVARFDIYGTPIQYRLHGRFVPHTVVTLPMRGSIRIPLCRDEGGEWIEAPYDHMVSIKMREVLADAFRRINPAVSSRWENNDR